MSEKLSNKDVELLQYYYKKKKKAKIIICIFFVVIFLCLALYIGYSVYSQIYWEVKEDTISVEYGETYEPNLTALVDTNKYSFITLDNTNVTSNIKNETDKKYPAIGNYEVTLLYSGKIKLFGIEKTYNSEKKVSVVVKDTTPPTIKAPEVIEILIGESLDMENYLYLFEVTDLSKTSELELDASNVDNNAVGEYTIIATVEDIYGNKQTCDVPCSIIEDPYGDVGIIETTTTENTTKETTTEAKTAESTKDTKPTTTKKATTKSNGNNASSQTTTKRSTSYKTKDFLFKDGYTMANVSEAATEYLRQSGKAGECIPLKDKDGIYIGMRVIIYE